MRKHLYFGFIVVLIILSLTVLFGEIRNGSIKSSENEKLIKIVVKDETSKKEKIVLKKRFYTSKNNLKNFLVKTRQLNVKVKKNEYGYLLTEIAGVKQDEKNGKWIVYESKNNEDCIKNGVCPAINKVKLKNGDRFTFELKKF